MQIPSYTIFDREFYKRNLKKCIKNSYKSNFLVEETSQNVAERVDEFSKSFDNALIYGLFKHSALSTKITNLQKGGLVLDRSHGAKAGLCFDEEFNTCQESYYDLVISNLSLHFVNDLPGALIQYRKILNKDGVFIATLFGGETLKELKDSFIKTDNHFYNGSTPHIIPFIDIRDGASLLQRAGFAQAISDSFIIKVKYSSIFNLFWDIKGIGQNNCLINRSKITLPKQYFTKLEEMYKADHNCEATFEIITITGFKT